MPRIASTLFLVFLLSVSAQSAFSKTVRLLTIGNSFAENALTYLPQIVEASDNTLVFEKANLGGCSLQRHWNHVAKYQANATDPQGRPYSNGRYSLAKHLTNEEWDFISIQQVSWQSHDLSTYYPYITDLHSFIRKAAPQAKLLAHQIWAYRVDDPRFIPENQGKEPHTQKVMYEQVRKAYHHIAKEFGLGILPSGDAMYLADTNPKWGYRTDTSFDAKKVQYPVLPDQTHSVHAGWRWRKRNDESYQLRMDGHHASDAGKYLLGCVWFEVFFGESIVGNQFIPEGIDSDYARFLQETAHQAVAKLKPINNGLLR